jgi:Ca2+-binding EF-hand superfamily protein
LKATKDYFSQETIEMQHLEEVLAKNGTGIKAFIQSLEEVFKFSETTSLDIHSFLTFLEFKIDLANEENKHIQKK